MWSSPHSERRPNGIVTAAQRERVLQQRRRQDYQRADLQNYLNNVRSAESAVGLHQRHGRGFVDHAKSSYEHELKLQAQEEQRQRQIYQRSADTTKRMMCAHIQEEQETAALAKQKMLQRLIEQDPELRRLRQHLDRAYQKRDNDYSAEVRAHQRALAEKQEKEQVAIRDQILRNQAEEERRKREFEQRQIELNRRDNWTLLENRHVQAQQAYRENLHRERLVNQFIEDQLQEEDDAAQRFAEENRKLVVAELRAQEEHHAQQKQLFEEQERLAREQDEWYQRVIDRRRRAAVERLKHKDEAHDRFIELFAQEVRKRRAREKELEWAKEVLERDALEKQWAAQDAEKRALAQLIHDEMRAGNEALKKQREAIIKDLKHREKLMVEEMMERARRAELAEIEEKQRRHANRERFIRSIEEQAKHKREVQKLQLEREVAEQRARKAAEQAYRDSVAAARRYLIEEHAPVLREYFPKVRHQHKVTFLQRMNTALITHCFVQAAFSNAEMLDALKDDVIFDDDGIRETPVYVDLARRGQYDARQQRDFESGAAYRS